LQFIYLSVVIRCFSTTFKSYLAIDRPIGLNDDDISMMILYVHTDIDTK